MKNRDGPSLNPVALDSVAGKLGRNMGFAVSGGNVRLRFTTEKRFHICTKCDTI